MCRHCGRLAYASQSDDVFGGSWRRQRQLERRLGDDLARPKGMHHRTHSKLVRAILACYDERDQALAGWLFKLNGRLRRLGETMGLDP